MKTKIIHYQGHSSKDDVSPCGASNPHDKIGKGWTRFVTCKKCLSILLEAKTQEHTPSPDELRLVLSTGGGANIKDGHGNVAVARIFPTEGWEQRASLYLAAPDLLEAAKLADRNEYLRSGLSDCSAQLVDAGRRGVSVESIRIARKNAIEYRNEIQTNMRLIRATIAKAEPGS